MPKIFRSFVTKKPGINFYLNNLGIKKLKKDGGWGQVFYPEPATPVPIFLGGFAPYSELCFGTLPIADKTKKLDEEKVINGKSRGIYLPTYLVSVFDVKQEKIKIHTRGKTLDVTALPILILILLRPNAMLLKVKSYICYSFYDNCRNSRPLID